MLIVVQSLTPAIATISKCFNATAYEIVIRSKWQVGVEIRSGIPVGVVEPWVIVRFPVRVLEIWICLISIKWPSCCAGGHECSDVPAARGSNRSYSSMEETTYESSTSIQKSPVDESARHSKPNL
jgi:hypothetical protein